MGPMFATSSRMPVFLFLSCVRRKRMILSSVLSVLLLCAGAYAERPFQYRTRSGFYRGPTVWFPSRHAQAAGGKGQRHVAQGFGHLAKAEYAEAKTAFNEAVLVAPGKRDAMFGLAWSLFAMGDYDYAAYCLRRAVARESQPAALRIDLPSLFSSRTEFLRLVRQLERATMRAPDDVDALSVLGVVYYLSGNMEAAEKTFRRVLNVVPSDTCARFFLRERGKKPPVSPQAPRQKKRRLPEPHRLGLLVVHSRPEPKTVLMPPTNVLR